MGTNVAMRMLMAGTGASRGAHPLRRARSALGRHMGALASMVCAAGIFAAGGLRAETLTQAWMLALDHDHALAAARLEAQAAQLETAAAKAMRHPALMASGSFVQFADAPAFDFSPAGLPLQLPELVDHDNTIVGSMMVTLPLYTSGRIASSIEAATQSQRAREATASQAEQDTKLAVAQAYVDVLRAQRALSVADSHAASLQSYVEEVRALFERETVARNDLLAAEVALADARQARLRAANALSLASASYNRLLGQPLTRELDLEPALTPLAGQLDREPVEALIARALQSRVELGALQAQAKAAGHRAQAERASLRPQLRLSGGYAYLENQALDRETFAIATLGFSWPLSDGGATRNRVAALRRTQQALQRRVADAEARIALGVRQAWLDLQEAHSRVGVTSDAVAQSEENLRITRRQYQAGLVTSTRVLEAQALHVLSRSNHDDAVLDAQLAGYRLARAVGTL